MSMSHLVAEPVNEPAGQRRTTGAAIAVVALIIVAVIVIGGPSFGPPGGAFTAWVNEVQDDDGDRGWNRLETSIQDAYGGDRDAYLADVERVDWDQFRVDYPAERWSDDGFARVEAALVSAPSSVPAFLFDRRIIHGSCDENGQPTGHRSLRGSAALHRRPVQRWRRHRQSGTLQRRVRYVRRAVTDGCAASSLAPSPCSPVGSRLRTDEDLRQDGTHGRAGGRRRD